MKMAIYGSLSLTSWVAPAEYTYMAVYNGLGGNELCLQRLHMCLKKHIIGDCAEPKEASSSFDWGEVMLECFSIMDEEVEAGYKKAPASSEEIMMGSTAVMVVVRGEDVVVAHCGDSRVVLSRNDMPVPLSKDHKLGGETIKPLAISRSLGDNYLKLSGIEVIVFKRSEMDDFLIIGNDGLFDYMSDKSACRIVKDAMMGTPGGIQGRVSKASAELTASAMSKKSKESMCATVVMIN